MLHENRESRYVNFSINYIISLLSFSLPFSYVSFVNLLFYYFETNENIMKLYFVPLIKQEAYILYEY